MYNTSSYQNLIETAPGDAWASLERLDGKGRFEFLVNPEEESWTHTAEFSKLPVALTGQPLVKYKYSDTILSLPKVLFITPGNARSIKPVSDMLMSFTKPISNGADIPLLKFIYGDTLISRCYLSKFTLTSQMKLGGNISMANGSLDLLMAPEPPKVELAPKEEATNTIKLTEKELTDAADLVKKAIEADPKLQEKYKTNPKTDNYNVTTDKKVYKNGAEIATLEDILGANLPSKWATVKAK